MFKSTENYGYKKYLFFAMAIFIFAVFFVLLGRAGERGVDSRIQRLDKEWNLVFRDTTFKIPELSKFKVFHNLKKGDTLVYTKILDKSVEPLSILRFNVFNSAVQVSLGGKILYSYGEDLFEQGELLGSGYHYVTFPSSIKGRKLKIFVRVGENLTSNPCSAFEIIHTQNLFDYFSRHSFSLGVGLFLVLLGALSVSMGLIAMTLSKKAYRLTLIGTMAFLMGVWTLCYMKVVQVFSMDFSFNTCLEYVCLFLMPIPMELLLLNMRRGKIKCWKWKGLIWLTISSIFVFVLAMFLQLTNLVHFPVLLRFFHAYVAIGLGFLVFCGLLYDRRSGFPDKIFASAISVLFVFIFVDLIRYNLSKIYAWEDPLLCATWLPMGSLLFIVLLIISYFAFLYDVIMDNTEKEVLKQLVFRDTLTGLYNRAKCEQIFDVLDKSSSEYAIVSIDMNGLKKVNDSKGHSEGDRMIVGFAEVFRKAFSGVGTTIRMGGDEFVAVVREEHLRDLEGAVEYLKKLEKKYSVGMPSPLDASIGFAFRRIGDDFSAIDVYRMADAKMYVMKESLRKK